MPIYRRRKGSDIGHWCRNCSNCPKWDYDERDTKPTYGEHCDECIAKEREANCRK